MGYFSGINGFAECNRNCALGSNIEDATAREIVVTVGTMVSVESVFDFYLLT
ncbi:MAG: hypothetical protein QF649_05945 [SAR324 cluster bacterium]|nr:hypothetical protein [SAR324 cluster bacterium]